MTDDGLIKKTFRPGEVIFAEGDVGDEAYIIEQGAVEIAKKSGTAELVLSIVEPGEVIGEMALIDKTPRMATARAAKPSTLIVIHKDVFDKILGKTDAVVRVILSALLGRLRSQSQSNVKKTL